MSWPRIWSGDHDGSEANVVSVVERAGSWNVGAWSWPVVTFTPGQGDDPNVGTPAVSVPKEAPGVPGTPTTP